MPSAKFMHRNLNLLIRHRTRIAQEIAATREQIAAVRQQIRDLKKIRADLAAIDRTLSLHDIPVDPDDIIPVHNKYKRLNLPHGEMSLCIYAAIRASGGPTTRSSIFAYLTAKHPELVKDAPTAKDAKRSLHDRLKSLARQGRLIRHHKGLGSEDGIWSFPSPDVGEL